MANPAGGTGDANNASVRTESNVERLTRELEEARVAEERKALENNITNAEAKADFHKEQAEAAKQAVSDAKDELKAFDEAQAKEGND